MKTLPLLIFVCLATFISLTYSQAITGLTAAQALAAGLAGVAAAVAGGAGLAALLAAAASAGGGGGNVQQPANNYGYQQPANNYGHGQRPHGRSFNNKNYNSEGYPTIAKSNNNFGEFPPEYGYYPNQQQRPYRYKREINSLSVEALAEMDAYDCGKQYLCELTAIQASQHYIQDPVVLSLIQNKIPVAQEVQGFRDAALLGLNTKDIHQCSHRYKLCATGKQTMVSIVQFLAGVQEGNPHTNTV